MTEEKYPFQHFSVLSKIGEGNKEYISRANEQINEQIRKEILRNMSRSALYTLYFIINEETLGSDSFTIIEKLKRFMLQIAQEDKEIGLLAKEAFEGCQSDNERKAEKFNNDIKQ